MTNYLADGSVIYVPDIRIVPASRELTEAERKGERYASRVACDTDPMRNLPDGARFLPVRGFAASVVVMLDGPEGRYPIGWMDTLDIPGGPFGNVAAWLKAGAPGESR